MCCFSGRVREVKGTRIFAGDQGGARQWLVYEMHAAFAGEVAMVLPLPVPLKSADDAVRFVSFEHVPTFFSRLDALFPGDLSIAQQPLRRSSRQHLAVHQVGAFVASFVPGRSDFGRLDPRFRLPDAFFTALPQFGDYGFAVFQLKAPAAQKGLLERLGLKAPPAPSQHFHPMVIDFPRRDAAQLFFPTVHLHDGQVAATAEFDHQLYAQRAGLTDGAGWETVAPRADDGFFQSLMNDARGVLAGGVPLAKRRIQGTQPNADVWL